MEESTLALDLLIFVKKMELKERSQLHTTQHLMVWLNATIGQYVKGFFAICPQKISLKHLRKMLYKLEYKLEEI